MFHNPEQCCFFFLCRHFIPTLEYPAVGGVGGLHHITSCVSQTMGHLVLPGLPYTEGHLYYGPWASSITVGYCQCEYINH